MDVLAYIFNVTLCQHAVHGAATLTVAAAGGTGGGTGGNVSLSGPHNVTGACGSEECLAMKMEVMCSVLCCARFCCHKSGLYSRGSAMLWGLYPLHLFAIVVGAIVFLMLLIVLAIVLTRRVFPWCGQWYITKTISHEEPISEESDVTDVEDEQKEDHLTETV